MKRFFILLGFLFILLTLTGSWIEKVVNQHLAAIDQRMELNRLTFIDRLECKLLYKTMILLGKPFYPEGANILEHYIQGSGKALYLNPEYIKESTVVVRHLKKLKVGSHKEIRFHQNEDWRLSYALNPFKITKEQDRVRIYQRILFKNNKGVYTNLNLLFFKVRLPDRLIHVLNPKPFTAYSEWNIN